MKQLLILLIILAAINLNAQGWIGHTDSTITLSITELSLDVKKTDSVNTNGIRYTSLLGENYEWVLFHNKNGLVYQSRLISLNLDEFLGNMKHVKANYTDTGDGWIKMFTYGAVTIDLEMSEASPFPVFLYGFKYY